MLNATLSVVFALLVALSVFDPTTLMLRLSNVALPFASVVRDVVPFNGPAPLSRVIVTVAPDTLLPNESCARTVTAGVMLTPAAVSVGGCTNVTAFTAPAVMLNGLLTTTPG